MRFGKTAAATTALAFLLIGPIVAHPGGATVTSHGDSIGTTVGIPGESTGTVQPAPTGHLYGTATDAQGQALPGSTVTISGGSTTMRLQVFGTAEVLEMKIVNKTPEIISVEGGVNQTVPTSGGQKNVVDRKVQGLERGNFNIGWELDAGGCPCPESMGPGSEEGR